MVVSAGTIEGTASLDFEQLYRPCHPGRSIFRSSNQIGRLDVGGPIASVGEDSAKSVSFKMQVTNRARPGSPRPAAVAGLDGDQMRDLQRASGMEAQHHILQHTIRIGDALMLAQVLQP